MNAGRAILIPMSKNPFLNGVVASAYIVLIVSVMNFGTKLVPHPNTFIAPMAVVSLFTLSAAVMGYLFCYVPVTMYFDGKKKQAVSLFLQTTAVFASITALILTLLFSGVLS